MEANQLMSEYSSTMTEVLSEKGMNINGDKIVLLHYFSFNAIHLL